MVAGSNTFTAKEGSVGLQDIMSRLGICEHRKDHVPSGWKLPEAQM